MATASWFARLVLGFLLVATTSFLWIPVAVLLLPWRVGRIKLCNLFGKTVGHGVVALTGADLVVHDRERINASMPAVYVANHASNLDVFLCFWLCPFGGCGVVKKEFVYLPFIGLLYLLSGHLRVDRQNHERAVSILKQTAAFVRQNRLGIWIMPEGTRSVDGSLLEFKRGFVHLAIAAGLPVVPVVIRGAREVWPKGSLRFFARPVEVSVLPAVDTSAWREETAASHAQSIRAMFLEKLADKAPAPVAG